MDGPIDAGGVTVPDWPWLLAFPPLPSSPFEVEVEVNADASESDSPSTTNSSKKSADPAASAGPGQNRRSLPLSSTSENSLVVNPMRWTLAIIQLWPEESVWGRPAAPEAVVVGVGPKLFWRLVVAIRSKVCAVAPGCHGG